VLQTFVAQKFLGGIGPLEESVGDRHEEVAAGELQSPAIDRESGGGNIAERMGGRRSFPWANIGGFDVLVAEALDFVVPFLLVEADFGRGHDLSGAFAFGVERHLKKTERVVGGAPIVVQLYEGHGARRDDGDDSVCPMLTFARDGDLIARGAHRVDAALIFFVQCPAECVGPFVFDKLGEILDFFIGGELRDPKIKLDCLASDAPASADGDTGVGLWRSFILGDADKRHAHE